MIVALMLRQGLLRQRDRLMTITSVEMVELIGINEILSSIPPLY